MAAVNRRDISKAGYRAVLTELKRHWYERGQCPFTVSVETCNTVSFFSSLKSSSISHNPTSPRVTEFNSLSYRGERRQIRFPNGFCEPGFQSPSPRSWQKHDRLWACKGWKVEYRSYAVLNTLICAFWVLWWVYVLVLPSLFTHELQDLRSTVSPPLPPDLLKKIFACLSGATEISLSK